LVAFIHAPRVFSLDVTGPFTAPISMITVSYGNGVIQAIAVTMEGKNLFTADLSAASQNNFAVFLHVVTKPLHFPRKEQSCFVILLLRIIEVDSDEQEGCVVGDGGVHPVTERIPRAGGGQPGQIWVAMRHPRERTIEMDIGRMDEAEAHDADHRLARLLPPSD
jgi:hypothetical protein